MERALSMIARVAMAVSVVALFACQRIFAAPTEVERSFCSGYGKERVDFFWGSTTNSHLSAAVKLGKEQLNGRELVALKFCMDMASNMKDCMIFIKSDLLHDGNLYEQEFYPCEGWNVIWLDFPFSLEGLDELYVGYELTCNDEAIGAVGVDAEDSGAVDADCVRTGYGDWTHLSDIRKTPVHLALSAILTGGDYSGIPEYGIGFLPDVVPSIVKAGEPFDVYGEVVNKGIVTLRSFSVDCTVDGNAIGEPVVFAPDAMFNYGIERVVVPVAVDAGRHEVCVTVSIDGQGNGNQEASFGFVVDSYDRVYPELPLVEVFTSQYCSNCPGGEAVLDRVLDKSGVSVARIHHHAGYTADFFTIPQSEELAGLMGVGSAPSMCLCRDVTRVAGGDALVYHPAYSSVSQYSRFKRANTLVGLSVSGVYYVPDEKLKVVVAVEKDEAAILGNPMLNVVVCENHVDGFQLGAGTTYVSYDHNHVVRLILTPLEGRQVGFDAQGRAEFEFVSSLPATKDGLNGEPSEPVVGNLEIVAFLADGFPSVSGSAVYNSATAKVEISEDSGIALPAVDGRGAELAVGSDGTVGIVGDGVSAVVYDAGGRLCGVLSANSSLRLPGGIYIVRFSNGAVSKVVV